MAAHHHSHKSAEDIRAAADRFAAKFEADWAAKKASPEVQARDAAYEAERAEFRKLEAEKQARIAALLGNAK